MPDQHPSSTVYPSAIDSVIAGQNGAERFYNVSDFIADLRTGKFSSTSERLPLGTPVRVDCLGIEGVISGHSTCDGSRYRVTWFDRRLWTVRHKWVTKGVIEVAGSKSKAAAAA